MPCRDGGPYEVYENPDTRRRLDTSTMIACEAFQIMSAEQIASLPKICQKWWKDHQEADRVRKERENDERNRQLRRSRALAKLTPEERRALGL